MPDLFMLMLLLDEAATFSASDVRDAFLKKRPLASLDVVSAGGGGDPFMIAVDAVPVTLMSIAAPIPSAELDLALQATPWIEAKACVSRSRAHIVVSAMNSGQTFAERMAIAHAVTDVVGREIEFGPTTTPAARISNYVLGVAELLLSGTQIDDGHTVSLEGVASMVQVSVMPKGLLQDKPAYHLSAVARA